MHDEPHLYLHEKEFVLSKCRYFVDVQVWPLQAVTPEPWLENFSNEELPYAVHLLNQFQFFSNHLTDALLRGTLLELSRDLASAETSADAAKARWEDFLGSVIITYPTGERPRPTDSGHTFARKARQVLEFPESRILGPNAALEYLKNQGPRPLLFLDDFLGTGRQFVTTWQRMYQIDGEQWSFASLQNDLSFPAYYLPLISAQRGLHELATHCPGVLCRPAHILPIEYSAVHMDSLVWPAEARAQGRQVIHEASLRAGIPDTDGKSDKDWQGFGKLGLCLGFEHGTPDATLPLFYWEQNGWKPLVRRT